MFGMAKMGILVKFGQKKIPPHITRGGKLVALSFARLLVHQLALGVLQFVLAPFPMLSA